MTPMSRCALCAVLLSGGRVLAQAAETAAAAGPVPAYQPPELHTYGPSPALVLLQMFGALAVVVGTVVFTGWLVRVRGRLNTPVSGSKLHLVETLPLGPTRQLYLVAVGSQVLLLGAGSGEINNLASFAAADIGFDPSQATAAPSIGDFLSKLREARFGPDHEIDTVLR